MCQSALLLPTTLYPSPLLVLREPSEPEKETLTGGRPRVAVLMSTCRPLMRYMRGTV